MASQIIPNTYLGDFAVGATIYHKFISTDEVGLPTLLSGTPAISIYKDADTTQSTAGVGLTTSFDSVTGLNHVAVDTSADGAFYASGSTFHIVITTGTVDATSVVGYVVGTFSLTARQAFLDTVFTEPTTTFSWASASLRTIIPWLGALSRNKITQSTTTQALRNDADGANIATSTVSDSGSVFTRGEWS